MTVQKAKTIELKKPETMDLCWHILDISQFFDLKANLDRAAAEVKKPLFGDKHWQDLAIFSHLLGQT